MDQLGSFTLTIWLKINNANSRMAFLSIANSSSVDEEFCIWDTAITLKFSESGKNVDLSTRIN